MFSLMELKGEKLYQIHPTPVYDGNIFIELYIVEIHEF